MVVVIFWLFAYHRRKIGSPVNSINELTVSVVVAARNEAVNIPNLLESLLSQDHGGCIEVVVCDDSSEDDTFGVLQRYIPEFEGQGWVLQSISADKDGHTGKKQALRKAIERSTGDLILTTDADCIVPPSWVRLMSAQFADDDISFVAGYVILDGGRSFIERFQATEQAMLSLITCAAVNSGLPFMSNGANLAFRRKAYDEVQGYAYGSDHPGGDDTFLMLSMNKRFPGSLRFIDDRSCAVRSSPVKSWMNYLHQRKRHASKVPMYDEVYIKFTGAIIMIANALHLLSYLLIVGFEGISGPAITFLAVKITLDLVVGFTSVIRFGSTRSYFFVILFAFVYPIYLMMVSFLMVFKPGFNWKGRSY
jgi:cellulose synthase/poly-beta-1,6-N-acetylglucosamine synthase-like glycosyltransferase